MQVPQGVDGLKLYPLWHVLHEPECVPHINISVKELWSMLLDTSLAGVSFENDVEDANAVNHEVFRKLTISGIKVMQSITCMKENTLSLDERFKMRTFVNTMNRYDFSEEFYYKIVPLTGIVNTVGSGGIWACVPVSEGEEDSSRVETKTSFIVAQNPVCDTPIALLPIDLLRKPSYYQAANRTNAKETSTEKIWSAMQQPTQYIATEFDSSPDTSCLYQYSHWMVHLMYYLCDGNSAFELGPTDKDLMFPMARYCWKKCMVDKAIPEFDQSIHRFAHAFSLRNHVKQQAAQQELGALAVQMCPNISYAKQHKFHRQLSSERVMRVSLFKVLKGIHEMFDMKYKYDFGLPPLLI